MGFDSEHQRSEEDGCPKRKHSKAWECRSEADNVVVETRARKLREGVWQIASKIMQHRFKRK